MATIDEELKMKFMNDQHRFITNVIFTSNWIQRIFNDFLAPFGLSSPQFNILRILRGAKDWVSMNEIKSVMIEMSPHTTRLADKLLEKELIERRRGEKDRRVVYLNVTDKGLALLKEIDDVKVGEQLDIMSRVSDEEAKQMSAILDKLRR